MQPTGDQPLRTKKKHCIDCGAAFDSAIIEISGIEICSSSVCPWCMEVRGHEARETQAERDERELWEAFWARIPALFADTELARLPECLQKVSEGWQFGPRGLGLIGASGAGKTRAAAFIARRVWPSIKSLCFLKATKLTRLAAEKYSDDPREKDAAKQAISSAYKSKLLILDDIGKGRLTPTAEEMLFDLIDERSERQLPIIWTSNATGQELRDMLSPDRAAALTRRLAEFSEIIHVK